MKKLLPFVGLFFLSACSVTQHTEGALGDACIGIPYYLVSCFIMWMMAAALCGIFLNTFSASILSAFIKLDEDNDKNLQLHKVTAFAGAIVAIVILVFYFVFMYPDSQAIASGASSCSSIIGQ